MGMPSQIVLEWAVNTVGSSFNATKAATALGAVPLYSDMTNDPVLGQLFGLTVESDVTGTSGFVASRTLTLNMSGAGPTPPPFPCHPDTSTPPALPFQLRRPVTLFGSFAAVRGSMVMATTMSQIPSLVPGESIQFLSQKGVFYTVAAVGPTGIGLTAPYTGTSKNTGAFKMAAAPVTRAAIYSTSPLDTAGVATSPAIPAGPGVRTVVLTYFDSTGAGPFNTSALLTGKRPAALALAGGSVDIASISGMVILAAGGFANNIGQLTLVELSEDLPSIPSGIPIGTGVGAGQGETFASLTDEAQMLISRHLVYMPPSYFALAQQGASAPQLAGDFLVTTDSKDVPTTADQTTALAAGNVIRFASQNRVFYTIAAVTPKLVTLTTAYSGIDDNFTGQENVNSNIKTKGNLGDKVIKKVTGAFLAGPSPAAPPTNDQLSGPLGQFLVEEVAVPPPNNNPAFVAAPTFLSGLFTRTLSLALATPVAARPITFV